MKKRVLDKQTGTKVSALGLGCMGMAEWYGPTDDAQSIATIQLAYEMGVTLFDTADMYGKGKNEEVIGSAIKPFRKKIILATKCGIVREKDGKDYMGINGTPEYIKSACEASLKRLGVDCVDLYYLHRIDPNVPIEESMKAMIELIEEGKIRFIGLSEANEETIRRAHKIHPVTALQTEYSVGIRKVAESVLPACQELGITFIPYSPIGRGLLSGQYHSAKDFAEDDFRRSLPQFQDENLLANFRLISSLEKIAAEKKCTTAQLSLAWLLARGENIIPIPGTKQKNHLKENLEATNIELSSVDMALIETACSKTPLKGERLPQILLEKFGLHS